MGLFYQKAGSLVVASWAQAALALSVCKLFKNGFLPTPNTTKAELQAQEADYDGYASQTFTAWNDPGFASAGGSSIDSGYKQFAYVDGVGHVGNVVGGFWVEDAGGDVIVVGTFDTPYNMTQDGNITPVEIVLNFGS